MRMRLSLSCIGVWVATIVVSPLARGQESQPGGTGAAAAGAPAADAQPTPAAAPADTGAAASPASPQPAKPTAAPSDPGVVVNASATSAAPSEADYATPEEDAAVMHAQALLAEHGGQLESALWLLRQASERAPKDAEISFDRARIALLEAGGGEPDRTDVDGFLQTAPDNAESLSLRAYILAKRGETAAAEDDLAKALLLQPTRPETLALRDFVTPKKRGFGEYRISAMAQGDTNVTLVDDGAPSKASGSRFLLDAEARIAPWNEPKWLSTLVFGQFGVHMNDRTTLSPYDAATFGAAARAASSFGPHELDATLVVSDVLTDSFAHQFMQEVAARGLWTVASGILRPGMYAGAGVRNFTQGNREGEAFDRDGPNAELGAMLELPGRGYTVLAQAGFQGEFAQGKDQRERGVSAMLLSRMKFRYAELTGGLGYELRDYYDSAESRQDHRLSPMLSGSFPIIEQAEVTAGYAYTLNSSNSEFDYSRHVFQLGVTGNWQ